MKGCTKRQIAFCEYYLKTCKTVESAMEAGYRNKIRRGCIQQAYRLFQSPAVQDYLQERLVIASRDMVDEMIDMLICMQEQIEITKDFNNIRKIHKAVFRLHNTLLPKEEENND